MSKNFDDNLSLISKPKARETGKVLCSQKLPTSTKTQPDGSSTAPEKGMQVEETIKLASGEKRSVTIEATNDKEWQDFVVLVEGSSALSLDQKDMMHRTIGAIAALRVGHQEDWKSYCESRGMKWRKEAKSQFQSPVKWMLDRNKKAKGEDHTSKASMIAGCLDEYWEIHRPLGMKPEEIAAWLEKMGGYTAVYRDRLDRLRDPKDKTAERYGRYLNLPPLEERDSPHWLDGFEGEVVISACIDRNSGMLEYRSVWRPEGNSFWYKRLDHFIAARPDYGKAVEPVRTVVGDTHIQDEEAWQIANLRDEMMAPADPPPADEADEPEPHDENLPPVGTDLRARRDQPEAAINANVGAVAGCTEIEVEPASDDAQKAPATLDCRFPTGCRYIDCAKHGRCLHQGAGPRQEVAAVHAS